MATYAIGDIQGCLTQLQQLLQAIAFNEARDTLWFTGDLVNRGPQSLETLRFIRALGERHITVLGNHDLHLLAVAQGAGQLRAGDTLDDILAAPDRAELLSWLSYRPLLHHDARTGYVMVHAGLAPAWTVRQAHELAQEVEGVLRGPSAKEFYGHMYGDQPDRWEDSLTEFERWRCIINYLTRVRFCHPDGRLDLHYKGEIKDKPAELIAWFEVPDRRNQHEKILFGHWAALNGKASSPKLYPLDTGCVWGNCLTAIRLEDEVRFSVPCQFEAPRNTKECDD